MNKRKALVTGASGFIGSHLCELLIKNKFEVRAFVRYNSRNAWGWLDELPCRTRIEVFPGDIRSSDSVRKSMEGVNVVFHLAALIGIPYSYHSPDSYVDTNVKGTLNLLQSARELGIEKFIQTSTSEVYGTAQFAPITETHPINPQSPYAATKSAADFLALSFYKSFNLPVTVIRPFNTYGPRQSARAVIPTIITQLFKNKKTVKLGSLHPTRDLTYVEDTARGFMSAFFSESSTGETVNLGNNSEISIGDLANLIAKLMGRKINIKTDAQRKRPCKSEVERLLADNSKARKILNWKPEIPLEKGLIRTIEWIKNNKDFYKPDIYNV